MDPPKALLDRISVRASSGSDYTFGNRYDRLPDNVSYALAETSRQGQSPSLPVDRHDPHWKHVADARSRRVRHAFGAQLADVDQSLYTLREASERSVRHHARVCGIDGLTGLKGRSRTAPMGRAERMERGRLDAIFPGGCRRLPTGASAPVRVCRATGTSIVPIETSCDSVTNRAVQRRQERHRGCASRTRASITLALLCISRSSIHCVRWQARRRDSTTRPHSWSEPAS